MRLIKSLLSPGTVLGVVALIVALAGTGVAASGSGSSGGSVKRAAAVSSDQGTVAKKKKKKKKKKSSTLTTSKVKSIVVAEIKKEAPTLSVAKANTANTANTATSANSAKIATNVLSANIRSDGTPLGSIPAGATSSKLGTGNYKVSFGRSIAGCTISAALASNGAPPIGMVAVGVIDANNLQVFTRDGANAPADLGTYVQAICPA